MDKQTFYSELTARLTTLGIASEFISRHISQFETYFNGKSDSEVEAEIAKLGDLDKVAARIKRMTEKIIAEAEAEQASNKNSVSDENKSQKNYPSKNTDGYDDSNDVRIASASSEMSDIDYSEFEPKSEEKHIFSQSKPVNVTSNSIKNAPIDPETLEKNRRKFWLLFALTLPITAIVLAITGAAFALTFFIIAVAILISVGVLILITAGGTVISVLGLIFGVSQMMSNLPVGLYESGIAICVGSIALFVGILVYNFAVRLMPFTAKWLLIFMKFIGRKYRELYIYLKKECIGI